MSNIPAPSTHGMDAFALFYSTYLHHISKRIIVPEVEVSPLPLVTSDAHSGFVQHIRDLRKRYNLILQLELSSASIGEKEVFSYTKCSLMHQIEMLEKLAIDCLFSRISLVKGGPSIKVEPPNKQRDLCISNGIEIWCFHLSPEDDRLAELKLVGEDAFVSAGVFKLGSDVYMVGGKRAVLSTFKKEKDECPIDHYRIFSRAYCRNKVEKSSRGFYRLSLSDNGLNFARVGVFGKLNKPKFWPIVEKIGDQVHVIDSFPDAFNEYEGGPNRFFSHEILDLNPAGEGSSWRVIENKVEDKELTKDDDYAWNHSVHYICSHLVVGNHIYALADRKYLKFTAEAEIWEAHPRSSFDYWGDPFSVRNVWHILGANMATRCVGEFPVGGGGMGPLYIIYAVRPRWTSCNGDYDFGPINIAYLVTLTGDVVCFQRFLQHPLSNSLSQGTIIKVEEEEMGKKALYSVIVNGSAWMDSTEEFLSINTFEAEALTENASEVRQIWAKGREVGWPVEQDFVRVHVKDKYEYKSATFTKDVPKNGRFLFPTMQACFL